MVAGESKRGGPTVQLNSFLASLSRHKGALRPTSQVLFVPVA